MRQLSRVEIIAMLFTGIAGLASAVQAYVSWETRGEVSRAIVFAQRLDACSKVIAAIEPLVAKARPEGRKRVASGRPDARYSLPQLYYGQSAGNPAFEAKHGPLVEKWRPAAASLLIAGPERTAAGLAYFDRVITQEIEEGRFMEQAELIAWLEKLEDEARKLTEDCRSLL